MIDIDRELRAAARAAREAAASAVDLEADLAATRVRATRPGIDPAPPSRRWLLPVAAASLVVACAGGLALLAGRGQESADTVAPTVAPTVASTTSGTVGPGPTTSQPPTPPSTVGPSTSVTAPTSTVPIAPTGPSAVVSYLDPPPELAVRPLATVTLPSRDDQEPPLDVAIGDRGVLVNETWAGRLTTVGFDGERREITFTEELAELVYGPGDVAYGLRSVASGGAMSDLELVAVALAGERQGEVVASTPLDTLQYLELPTAPFGHGPTGIVDRVRAVNETLFGYVDANGDPVAWSGAEPPLLAREGSDVGLTTIHSTGGLSWTLDVQAAPDRVDTFVGAAPAAPSSDGLVVHWTHLGNAAPGQDFGQPTMWVIATMAPDGTARWWSIPEGWEVVASDVWGTVLARHEGNSVELGLAQFGAPATPPPGTPTTTAPSTAVTPAAADCSGALGVDAMVQKFVEAMVEVRAGGDLALLGGCLDAVPAAFTGTVPACWTPCGGGHLTVIAEHLHVGTVGMPDGSDWWTISLPVTHVVGGQYADVIETWELHPAEGAGFRIGGVSVDVPPVERAASRDTIAVYLSHIERGDWMAAAEMLNGGGLELEARTDIQRLEPTGYTTAEIAAAIERWCRTGCDTTPPTLDELTFSGGFGLVRQGEEIRAGWFEGEYFIIGAPFRS